jgi:hypothetical protein
VFGGGARCAAWPVVKAPPKKKPGNEAGANPEIGGSLDKSGSGRTSTMKTQMRPIQEDSRRPPPACGAQAAAWGLGRHSRNWLSR